MEYYLYKNEQNIGPLPENEVIGGLRNGRFLSNDLGCRVGDSDWKDLSFFFPLETESLRPRRNSQIIYEPPVVRQQSSATNRLLTQPMVVYQPQPVNKFAVCRMLENDDVRVQ